jgi:tRNA (guanosine-2'-O-)-methyltransferase
MTPERVARLDAVLALRQPDLTVFAENLHKPRNFSAMVRNCDAVGINEMHVLPGEDNLRKQRCLYGPQIEGLSTGRGPPQ